MVAACVVLCAGVSVVFSEISAGLAGLSLTYALQFTDALLWTIRLHAQMEMNMNSMERIGEYLEIEQEKSDSEAEVIPPANVRPRLNRG